MAIENENDTTVTEGTPEAVPEVAPETPAEPVMPDPTLPPPPAMAPVDASAQQAPAQAPAPQAGPGGSITLTAEAFNALMGRLNNLEESASLMMQVQDRDKISKIEALRRSGKLVKSVKIRKYANKYIVGWRTLQDEVYKDESGRLVEKQTIELFYEDGSKSQMSMRQWASAPEYVPFEVTKESKDADGNLFFTVVGPDGKTIELNAAFIN